MATLYKGLEETVLPSAAMLRGGKPEVSSGLALEATEAIRGPGTIGMQERRKEQAWA